MPSLARVGPAGARQSRLESAQEHAAARAVHGQRHLARRDRRGDGDVPPQGTTSAGSLSAGTIDATLDGEVKPWPFTEGDDGIWTLTIGPIPPNIYVYKFVIDGAAVTENPGNPLR